MGNTLKCLCSFQLCLGIVATLVTVVAAFFAWGFLLTPAIVSGTIELPNAPGNAAITTERETGIQHIRGENLASVLYGQGYAHA
jgi:acyl-homoserine lactone acylase PvdQ